MATNFEDAYKAYTEGSRGQAVSGVYDAQTQAQLDGLQAAYDQNLSDREAARGKIGESYQAAGNDLQAQYERDRRSLNEQAAASGINTGAGSQQNLALRSVYDRDVGALRGQEAAAYTEADREIANLGVQYRAAVQQAQAEGDYRKMAALLDGYNQARQEAMQKAQLLAGFGNFSGYEGIFDQDQISSMRDTWIASNPLLAYNTGAITADQYYRMTGQQAPGVTPTAPAYYGGGGGKKAAETEGGGEVDISRLAYEIGTSRPDEARAAMETFLASPDAANMTEEQARKLATAYEHATGTGAYAPRTERA